jgi:hypothetical protein
MHRHMLAKNIPVADPHSGRRAFVFQILRRFANDTTGEELISLTDDRLAGQINMWADNAIRSNRYALINDGIGPNLHGGMEFCLGMDYGGMVNHE